MSKVGTCGEATIGDNLFKNGVNGLGLHVELSNNGASGFRPIKGLVLTVMKRGGG